MEKNNRRNDKQPAILLVDDNPINLQTLFHTLDGKGFRLLVAKSGEEALQIAFRAKPAVILLDIMMPGIDGYETLRRLKADKQTKDACVIFLTALHDTKSKVHGLSLGAMDFITKPFDPDEIIARVARQIEVYRRQQELIGENLRLANQLKSTQQSVTAPSEDRIEWVKGLILKGESDRVEFKSTLRWNLKTGRSEKSIEKAWLKSIVAFLNTDGGVLLVGVEDNGHILGLEADQFQSEDKYLLHVNNKLKQHIGLEWANFIRFQTETIGDKKLLWIECLPSPAPVFFKMGNDEEFYVRVGPGSRRLSPSEVLTYVANRSV
jgi:DNA-binding response OmpR family regulator